MKDQDYSKLIFNPLVSVVITCFNSARFIPAAIDSILNQTYSHIEIIVVDDGSTDNTDQVLLPYKEHIQYHWQNNFGGPSRPRNVGVKNSQGQLVSFIDADDVMMPDAIENAVTIFTTIPQVDIVFTDFQIVDERGEITKKRGLAEYREFRRHLKSKLQSDIYLVAGKQMFHEILHGLFLGISSIVIRKESLLAVGPFDESLKNSDDRDMWMRLARQGSLFAFRDKVQFSYRRHSGTIFRKEWKRFPSMIKVLEKQVPYLDNEADIKYLQTKLNSARLGYARGLRLAENYSMAKEVYLQALSERLSWIGIRGLILTMLKKFLD